ncbi:MAG: acylneuraminate cytidylyltransferase family protein [Candidatus Gastranaerophilales bacterium]|nr:acylneuraminate cytidylyltransferase family protein [Candidatus Gastranaerophilales bacterium]
MNIVAIIPARGGSKRLPHKNIKLLLGKPLIAWSIESALKSKLINKVVVSTDSPEIADTAKQYGAQVHIRPGELAQDTTKTAPVLVDVVNMLEINSYKPDIIILLQPTCPVREGGLVDEALRILLENKQYDSIFTGFQKCYTMALWKLTHSNEALNLYDYHLRPRWQDVETNEKIMAEDGAFYAIRYDSFRKYSDFIGEKPFILEIPKTVDIDTQADFDKARELLLKG